MLKKLREKLIKIARKEISNLDVSHDFGHALRVLSNAERIAREEKADLDIIIPAALFHDLIVYPKDSSKRSKSQYESAEKAKSILNKLNVFTEEKVNKIAACILECSFSKGIIPKLLESKILQDADGLEATGAVSIMRTFSSSGQMKRPFYNSVDPFCKNRNPSDIAFALDLFYTRLLKVSERMHTKTAKKIAKRRTEFLREFLNEFKLELKGR